MLIVTGEVPEIMGKREPSSCILFSTVRGPFSGSVWRVQSTVSCEECRSSGRGTAWAHSGDRTACIPNDTDARPCWNAAHVLADNTKQRGHTLTPLSGRIKKKEKKEKKEKRKSYVKNGRVGNLQARCCCWLIKTC